MSNGLTYYVGFTFKLNQDNERFMEFYREKRDAGNVWIYTIAVHYFYDNMSSELDSLNLYTGGSPLADESLRLSVENIENWDALYQGGLEAEEVCCIAIPGYGYQSATADTCFSLVRRLAGECGTGILHGMSITDYAELVEKLHILRFGIAPQSMTPPVKYFLPGGQIGSTLESEEQTPRQDDPEIPDITDSAYKVPDKVEWFIIHQAGENSHTLAESTIMGWKAAGQKWRCHLYILNDCRLVWLVPFREEATGTKQEVFKRPHLKGTMIHVELCYYSNLTGIASNTNNTDEGPSDDMYNKLAEVYAKVTATNNRKLKIMPHREIDRGITVPDAGHNDPWNFDFDKLYRILKDRYNIEIDEGVEGTTQARYLYWNQGDHKIVWPPGMSGRPPRD